MNPQSRPPGDPAPQQGDPATPPSGEPTPSQQTGDPSTPNDDPAELKRQLDAARAELAKAQSKLDATSRESIKRRKENQGLKSIEEQHADLLTTHQQLEEKYAELEAKLQGYVDAEEADRSAILAEMTEADRTLFGKLGITELRAIRERLKVPAPAPAPVQQLPEPSPGTGLPPAPGAASTADLESAIASNDKGAINRAMDRILKRN